MKKFLLSLLVATITLGSSVNAYGACKVVKATHSKVADVKGTKTCQGMAAMTNIGNDAYFMKFNINKPGEIAIGKITDFRNKKKRKTVVVPVVNSKGSSYVLEHANSMTTDGKYLYIAGTSKDKYVYRINPKDIKKGKKVKVNKTYKLDGFRIASINYYDTAVNGVKRFLVSVKKDTSKNTATYTFRLVKIDDKKIVYDNVKFNVLGYKKGYTIGNDSYYDIAKKQLYITVFKPSNTKIITKNAVVQYDLSVLKNKRNYEAKYVILADIDNKIERKFEIEGMFIVDGKKYICTNSWNYNKVNAEADYIGLLKKAK